MKKYPKYDKKYRRWYHLHQKPNYDHVSYKLKILL